MAQAGVIRDFMVALGFKTDNSGLKQMQDAMGGVENKANLLKGINGIGHWCHYCCTSNGK
jgi:hypothetical protein